MAKTYSEFLIENGATPEDLKTLVNPASEKAYNAMQAQIAAETAKAAKAEADKTAVVSQYDTWYNDQAVPAYKKMEQEAILAKANEARARAAIEAAQKAGLVDLAKDLGYEVDPAKAAEAARIAAGGNPPANFDPSKYIDRDTFMSVVDREGDAIALAQDIAAEHARLFPGMTLNFRELRKEAVTKKQPVEQLWMEKYKVADARAAKAQIDKDAYEKKLRDEGAAAARAELAAKYGDPNQRPLMPSTSPFTQKQGDVERKQPWDVGDRSNERVQKATAKVVSSLTQ